MNMFRRIYRVFTGFIDRLIRDERFAGRVRFLFAISLIILLVGLGYYFFEQAAILSLSSTWLSEHPRFAQSVLKWIALPVIYVLYFLQFAFRHMILPLSVFVGILWLGARYVDDIYELHSRRLALRYVLAVMFSLRLPFLLIENGRRSIPPNVTNLLDVIGGPGFLVVRPGNAVLLESLRAPSSARADGFHFISRYDTIKEIVSLEDQHGFIERTAATTKDGIEIVVRDVHYRYRLKTGRRFGDYATRQALEPYPFSIQAIRNMAYNRSVRSNGLTPWHAAVELAVDSGITDYIKEHLFDHLTAPRDADGDPRKKIREGMLGSGLRERLRNVGAELLWFDIGHFSVSEREIEMYPAEPERLRPLREVVSEQRVETWGAKWLGSATLSRSHGEASRLAYQELGRAEGEAVMLDSIINALAEARRTIPSGDPKKQLKAIVMSRTAQTLESLAEAERRRAQPGQLPPPNSGTGSRGAA
jgi:hypothetical protein